MSEQNKNQPVFPDFTDRENCKAGLTKREYFAGLAMQGYVASMNPGMFKESDAEMVGEQSKMLADGLLKALES